MSADKAWKPLELVKVTADYLAEKGIPNARLDAEILLCRALDLEKRIDLYAGFEREISPGRLARFREMVRRRAGREPVSRILGERGFMGLTMRVTPAVLSPRPETELLVEAVLEKLQPKKPVEPEAEPVPEQPEEADGGEIALAAELDKILDSYGEDAENDDLDEADTEPAPESKAAPTLTLRQAARMGTWRTAAEAAPAKKPEPAVAAGNRARILELGTGSGCIAVSLAALYPAAFVVAVDISSEALETARQNAEAAGVPDRVEFRESDWFGACRADELFDIIVSNPPYLVEGDPDIWPEAAQFDPPLALYGGPDGLDAYRVIAREAGARLRPGGGLYLEVGAGQAEAVSELLRANGFTDVAVAKDYGGIERMVSGMVPGSA